MSRIENIQYLMSKNMLNEVFEKREDSLYTMTIQDKENIKELLKKRKQDYANVLVSIDNVPKAFIETKKMIETNINIYLETINAINGYDNEKFYKVGFSDGIQLILECLENKSIK